VAKKTKEDGLYRRLTDVGLRDPFIRVIAGGVVIAIVASYAISKLGSGINVIFAFALSLAFGVLLVVLRTLMKHVESAFVTTICYIASGIIVFVFLAFVVLLFPAVVTCWPRPYAQLLSLSNCASAPNVDNIVQKPFTPKPFRGQGIAFNPENGKYLIWVFYRPDRVEDAERIVGALRSAGYQSNGSQSTLDEVVAPDRRPDTSLIKTTALARPIVDDVSKIIRIAIPIKATFVSLFPTDAPLQRGNIQIDLF